MLASSSATSVAARRAARASLPLVTLGFVLLAAPARADVAEGWSNPDDVDLLQALLVLGGVPILLFVLIGLAVYVPALVRGEDVSPSAAGRDEPQWLGGPRRGTKELAAGDTEPSQTGGARGSW